MSLELWLAERCEPHQTCNQPLLELGLQPQPLWLPCHSSERQTFEIQKMFYFWQFVLWQLTWLTIHKTCFLDSRWIHHALSLQFRRLSFWEKYGEWCLTLNRPRKELKSARTGVQLMLQYKWKWMITCAGLKGCENKPKYMQSWCNPDLKPFLKREYRIALLS